MPTTVITGRDLTLTVDSKVYDAQVLSCTLKTDLERNTYETIDGKVYWALDTSATLTLTVLADWGASGAGGTYSICELLWAAANSAPNTALTYSLTAATGAVFSGSVYPNFPDVNGSGKDAQQVTFTLQGTAKPTLTVS